MYNYGSENVHFRGIFPMCDKGFYYELCYKKLTFQIAQKNSVLYRRSKCMTVLNSPQAASVEDRARGRRWRGGV